MSDSFGPACCGRRRAFKVAGVLGVGAVGALGGCSASDNEGSEQSPSKGSGSGSSPGSSSATTKVSEVPVGGGLINKDAKVVITQPTAGEFKAFSAVCTHEGCTVTSVKESAIVCACHGSEFDLSTGAATKGPATKALESKTVAVEGESLTIT